MSEHDEQEKVLQLPDRDTLIPAAEMGDDLVAMVRQGEKRIDAVKKVKMYSLSLTNNSDWIDEGGKPYLQASGAEKVGMFWGINWQLGPPELTWLEDAHYLMTVKGYFSRGPTHKIEIVGTRSSRDPFFSKSGGKDIPAGDIDRGDVTKAAVSNCIANGVTRILGIRNVTWEDLKPFGIERDKAGGRVDFKKGSADPNAPPILPNYGDYKGKPVTDPSVTDDWLKKYRAGAQKSLANPEYARSKPMNEKLIVAIDEELKRRETLSRATPLTNHAPTTATNPESSEPSMAQADYLAWTLDILQEEPALLLDLLKREGYKDRQAVPPEKQKGFIQLFNSVLKERDATKPV